MNLEHEDLHSGRGSGTLKDCGAHLALSGFTVHKRSILERQKIVTVGAIVDA